MNLKQLAITSIITLIVTVISGIVVNWYTKNNLEKTESKDNLYYRILDISEFKSDSTKISIFSLEILNKNKDKYTDIEFSVAFDDQSNIIDIVSKNDETDQSYTPTEKSKNKVSFKYPILFQNQKIKVNIAVKNLGQNPKIQLQSNETFGKKYIPKTQIKENQASLYFQIILLSFLLLLLIFLLFLSVKKMRNISSSFFSSLNDTAFLFLHSKQYDLANKLLINRIEKNGATSLELSNLATTEYLMNRDLDKTNSLLKMSKYISYSPQSKFVLYFNEFIIMAAEKNYLIAKENLEKCNKSNPKDLKKYITFSLIIKDLMDSDEIIKDLINQTNIL